ncbi:lytic murein transglycosylase [Streptomyces sp. NBC_00829]|uniref:lytic transglycosylase domain-containing protein n=1 Tax=Streptomyces sp. NBC_00829 TaxID=2903679 RepID=UPI00386BB8FA|nr:lytic transglycosylase domain-containing protein [Streptomyces sp. NBC_00829]
MAAQFGRRLRRGATTTAVAAAAVAALSASQAPGVTHTTVGDSQGASDSTPPPGTPVTGNSPYYTDLPPLNTPDKPGTSINLPANGPTESGIPATVLAAYKQAEQTIAGTDAGCHVPWQLLAAIGKVESGQAGGGKVDANGTTLSPILGPVLNGVGFANISDTDKGAYDGDATHDRAVGPMQFIPSTWETWGQDGNADGRRDPNNIYDAALAAGRYLCAGNRDLAVAADRDQAILGYNHSQEYLRTVLSWFEYYKRGTHEVPDGTGVLPVSNVPDSPNSTQHTTPTPTPVPTPTRTPKPTPSKPGGGTPSPSPTPTPTPTPTPAPVTRIERVGTGELTAMAGHAFTGRATVRVKNSADKTVPSQSVRFEIVGDTDARFADGSASAVLKTGADGTVASPALQAGEKTGSFTLRATVQTVRAVPAVDFAATVTVRAADAIARTDDKVLTAAPGTEFADVCVVKATYKGAVAPGVEVTATMVTAADNPAVNDKGPFFKDADGKTVRTLTGLKTDANGVLKLPKIFADDQSGTFLLRLTTDGGATVTVELKVAAPAA